ncbi:MAG: hypothetical protein COX40_03865 [Candidatus Omnitrophica bacterium CG23_combo_of_CG06-09_8_20_14_all_40_11]|nr:MAG: hypothetical protein COX40_03865 [Candidatus Omnitrophica bacterium CG23_combo_of_CG06-09_8_20_14_all_40_11]
MEEKNRYLFLELLFTFFLLEPVIFLSGDILSSYRLYITLGLIGGFSFSWFNRNKQSSLTRIFINLSVLGVFIWIIYSLLNSSLLYREVILTFIKGGIILEVIFSFNSCFPPSLTYIQALSFPLFMCFPVFVKDYNEVHAMLVLIYIICWIAILKIKFYAFLKPKSEKARKFIWHYPLFLSSAFFLIIVFISWLLFSHFRLGKIEEGGFFPKEDKSLEVLEKEYYDLQDKIQKEVTELIPELKSKEERYEVLTFLDSLIKESPYVMEVEKAELGLIDYLRRPGPGLEKGDTEGITFLIKGYVDKKTLLNLKRIKENIMDILKKQAFNIMERISILRRVNKIQYSNSYQQIREYEKELQKIINKSSVDIKIKRDLEELIGRFKEWKTLWIYHQKMNYLKKKIDSLNGPLKKEFANLLSDIEQIERFSDFSNVENKIKILKYTMPSQFQGLIKDAEGILDILSEFILPEEIEKLKEKLEKSNLPIDKLMEIEEALDNIKNIEEDQKFLEDLLKSQEGIKGKDIKTQEDILKEKEEKLILIKIIPDYSRIALGEEIQLVALGVYSDDSQEDLTLLGKWTGTDNSIASVSEGKVSTHSVGEIKVYVEFQGIKSLPASVIVEESRLVSMILSPQNAQLSMKDKLVLKAEGYFSDSSRKDITSLVTWKLANPRIIKIEKGKILPLKFGVTEVHAEYLGIESLPANIRIVVTMDWLIYVIIKGVFFLFLGMATMFIVLYVLTEKKKNNLKNSLDKNPAEFIVNLYENAKKILAIFNLSYKECLPPLSYAELVQKSYSIENNFFLRFTAKFEEARYSHHVLSSRDASLALNDYNNFLKILFSRYNKFSLFLKYCLALLERRPLFIPKSNLLKFLAFTPHL